MPPPACRQDLLQPSTVSDAARPPLTPQLQGSAKSHGENKGCTTGGADVSTMLEEIEMATLGLVMDVPMSASFWGRRQIQVSCPDMRLMHPKWSQMQPQGYQEHVKPEHKITNRHPELEALSTLPVIVWSFHLLDLPKVVRRCPIIAEVESDFEEV